MNMRDLIDLFEAPAQGKTGAQLAQTSGGQFMNRADRTNQAKVDAALGPGFKAGSAAANLALAKKFSQGAPAAPDTRGAAALASKSAPATQQTSDQIATAALNAQDNTPAADTRGAAALASKSAPATQQTSDQIATAALNAQDNTPAADTRGAAAMASKSAPAQTSDQVAANPVPTTATTATTAPTQNTNSGSGYTGDVGTASNNPAPKSDYQPVAGSSNLVSRTADKIAADAKAGPGGQNQATKSYGSAGEFFGAIGDKFKSLVGGNKPVDAMANSNAGNQTSSGYTATPAAAPAPTAAAEPPLQKNAAFGQVAEEELEEEDNMELEEMMRLSGLALNEKAVSKQQQKFMGMVHAMQKGEKVKGASPELKKAAKGMSKSDARDFAKTKHKGLPQKVDESFKLMLDEEGHTLEHIVNRFKHEVKAFLSGDYMAENLYDALYDYYLDRGEMPYGVAKAREGDPYTWVSARFEADIDGTVDVKVPLGEVGHDDTLNELARLAGLSESRVDECGDMGMNQQDTINVSTNMSSDGNKSVNISAQGEKAEELLSMLKLAGMNSNDSNDRPAMVVVGRGEEMMDEERETEYANTPEEEYQTVDTIIRQGNDLNREKRQYASKPRLGDNPMAESILDNDLNDILESILIRDDQDGPEIKKNPKTGRVSATYPAPKKPDQSALPLQTEPYHGPRSLKVDGERTGTENHGKEKEVDEGWEDVSNFIGDIVGTEASKLRGSQQLRDLDAMRKQYKGTDYEKQVNDRYDTHLNRLQLDQGEVVDKAGEPIKVLPPQQWKGK